MTLERTSVERRPFFWSTHCTTDEEIGAMTMCSMMCSAQIGKRLEDVMKPGAYEHGLCSALQFSLLYIALPFKIRKRGTVQSKTPVRAGLRECVCTAAAGVCS